MDAIVYGKVAKLEKMVSDLQTQVNNSNKLVTIDVYTPLVTAGYGVEINPIIDAGINKMLIKSIYVEGNVGSKIDIDIVSKRTGTPFLVYKNVVGNHVIYDILDLPYTDEDGTDSLHVNVKNDGTIDSAYRVRVTGVTQK